jgi:hypothetical protein
MLLDVHQRKFIQLGSDWCNTVNSLCSYCVTVLLQSHPLHILESEVRHDEQDLEGNARSLQGTITEFILVLELLASLVAQLAWCLATGTTTGRSKFDPQQRRKDFSSSLCIQTCSEAHPASCTVRTGGPLPGAKALPGRDADHSLSSSAEVENE